MKRTQDLNIYFAYLMTPLFSQPWYCNTWYTVICVWASAAKKWMQIAKHIYFFHFNKVLSIICKISWWIGSLKRLLQQVLKVGTSQKFISFSIFLTFIFFLQIKHITFFRQNNFLRSSSISITCQPWMLFPKFLRVASTTLLYEPVKPEHRSVLFPPG